MMNLSKKDTPLFGSGVAPSCEYCEHNLSPGGPPACRLGLLPEDGIDEAAFDAAFDQSYDRGTLYSRNSAEENSGKAKKEKPKSKFQQKAEQRAKDKAREKAKRQRKRMVVNGPCRSFKYDPFLRKPNAPPSLPEFDPNEFKL